MQDAGYREALKCNGMTIDEVKIKVEPCMSDGPKGGKKARPVRSKDWSQHTSPAPKVIVIYISVPLLLIHRPLLFLKKENIGTLQTWASHC